MSSLRSYSTATAVSSSDTMDDSSWTRVTSGRHSAAWGTPTVIPPPSSGRKPFSFASTETAAALDPTTVASFQPKKGSSWGSSRPGGAKSAIPRPLDIRSMSDFPTLGGGASIVARSTGVSWSASTASKTVEATSMAATTTIPDDDVDATLSFLRNRRQPAVSAPITTPSRTSRLAAIGTRCFDDGPMDYDGPDEDDDDGAGSYHVPEEGELNAELAVTRRAGDKSDW